MKIPDFSNFTTRLGLGIAGVIVLVVLWIVGFVILPEATITINTDVSTTSINTTVTAQVGSSELDLENNTIPAERVQVEKIDSVTVPATGEKNVGNKATGVIVLTNCIDDGEPRTIDLGSRFTKDGKTFETTEVITLKKALTSDDECVSAEFGLSQPVDAVAVESGASFNVTEGSMTSSISGILAYSEGMTGGTDELVKVISQEDVDKAIESLNGISRSEALSELEAQLSEDSKRPIQESLVTNDPETVASPAVGEEADETKVTMTVNYSMLGVSDDDLNEILNSEVQKNLGDTPVNIRDNGLNSINFSLSESTNEADTLLTIETVATIGPEINEEQIKQEIVGKKRGDIEKQVESIDGVRSVSVEYSPVWITTTPKSADKITIVIVEGEGDQ